jgi:hypothetical protein
LPGYINYGFLGTIKKDLNDEANTLFSFLYNNRSLIEDQQSLYKLFKKAITGSLRYSSNKTQTKPIHYNIKSVYSAVCLPQGRVFIKPRNKRAKEDHYLVKNSRTRLCDNKTYTDKNWFQLNEADRSFNKELHQERICQKCLRKLENKKQIDLVCDSQSYSTFRELLYQEAVKEMLAPVNPKTDSYLNFQDQFTGHLLIDKINQAAEEQLNWSNQQQDDLRDNLATIDKHNLSKQQLELIPSVTINLQGNAG